jgi:hypothetical protein
MAKPKKTQQTQDEAIPKENKIPQKFFMAIAADETLNDDVGIAKAIGYKASSVEQYIKGAKRSGLVRKLGLTEKGKSLLVRAFVLIETALPTPRTPGVNYQVKLIGDIRDVIRTDQYRSILAIENVDLVLGANTSIVLTLLSESITPIGLFVKCHLRTHEYVTQTLTLVSMPIESEEKVLAELLYEEKPPPEAGGAATDCGGVIALEEAGQEVEDG